jgi:hypothetical protein
VSNVELIGEAIRVWIIMLDPRLFAVFLAAAFLLAITPGPGIFYVLTRTLTGGIQEGVLSSLGTFLGGLIHVIAAALGLSAILSTSATAFLIVKYVGAVYLIWIGIRMIWTRDREPGKRSSSGNSARNSLRASIFPARVSESRLSARQSSNGPEQLFTWLDKMPLQPTERLQFVRGSNWSR